jgi:hypothetical protein
LKYNPKKEEVKGMLPLGCFPLEGERGSFSKLPQRINGYKKENFDSTYNFIMLKYRH